MRKIIAVLTCFLMLAGSVILPVFATQETDSPYSDDNVLLGDIDFDGAVTAADARLALRAAVGLENLSGLQLSAADFTQDGQLTADDARMILRTSAGLEGDVTEPTEPENPTDPEEPTVPVEPEPPTEHSHSYADFVCACGEVQDGHFHGFLKEWILDNHTSVVSDEYRVEVLATYDDGTQCAAVYAYETQDDMLVIATVLIAYDYLWVSAFTLPEDKTASVGVIEAVDPETGTTVGSGRFELNLWEYVAGESLASLTEFDGYSDYVSYYTEMAGISVTSGIQILHDHLRVQCGYVFDYNEMGLSAFNAAK